MTSTSIIVFFIKYYYVNEIKEDGMGGHVARTVRKKIAYIYGKYYLGGLGINVILKRIFN